MKATLLEIVQKMNMCVFYIEIHSEESHAEADNLWQEMSKMRLSINLNSLSEIEREQIMIMEPVFFPKEIGTLSKHMVRIPVMCPKHLKEFIVSKFREDIEKAGIEVERFKESEVY